MTTSGELPLGSARFHTTRWSVVRAAGGGSTPSAREALEHLCSLYWYPLYAFLRRRGTGPEDARDLTQGFFAAFLARDDLDGLDPDGGRFRSYLLGALKHYASDQRDRAEALKRGGGRQALSLELEDAEERYAIEPADELTPERLFERRWAMTLLGRVLTVLKAEQEAKGRGAIFERLKAALTGGEVPGGHRGAAEDLGLSEVAVKVAVHRLRARYRELLRAEVAQTVDGEGAVEDEVRWLFQALGR